MANMARKIGVRSVSVEMQERFAALSGDRNPCIWIRLLHGRRRRALL
jgi:hypothetical protein